MARYKDYSCQQANRMGQTMKKIVSILWLLIMSCSMPNQNEEPSLPIPVQDPETTSPITTQNEETTAPIPNMNEETSYPFLLIKKLTNNETIIKKYSDTTYAPKADSRIDSNPLTNCAIMMPDTIVMASDRQCAFRFSSNNKDKALLDSFNSAASYTQTPDSLTLVINDFGYSSVDSTIMDTFPVPNTVRMSKRLSNGYLSCTFYSWFAHYYFFYWSIQQWTNWDRWGVCSTLDAALAVEVINSKDWVSIYPVLVQYDKLDLTTGILSRSRPPANNEIIDLETVKH
jgi:hypothetical protein